MIRLTCLVAASVGLMAQAQPGVRNNSAAPQDDKGFISPVEFGESANTLGQEFALNGSAGHRCDPHFARNCGCLKPPSGMVAWWTGDNTTTDFFGTSNGLDSSPVTFAAGKVGAAFSFDGSSSVYLQIPNTALLEPTTAVSVDAWVNAASAPGIFKYILSKGAGDQAASYALYTGSLGGIAFYISPDGHNFFVSPEASPAIWDGQWHHIAGTFDGSAVHLYMDGQAVGSGTTAASVSIGYNLSVTNDAFIGSFDGNSTFSFVGEIDEVEVFNRALALSEIQAIFNAGSAGKCKNVVAAARGIGYWQNKNGQGIIANGTSTLGVCNSGTWLRQYAPFQDMSSTAGCSQVAHYVLSIVKTANANESGEGNHFREQVDWEGDHGHKETPHEDSDFKHGHTFAMNAMLKAQMLATALDTYFSDPALGGNKLNAPSPIGGVAIDITGASVSFGGATSLTVSQMLAYAASQSNAGGSFWYGNAKAIQERAEDAFEAINTMTAFAP